MSLSLGCLPATCIRADDDTPGRSRPRPLTRAAVVPYELGRLPTAGIVRDDGEVPHLPALRDRERGANGLLLWATLMVPRMPSDPPGLYVWDLRRPSSGPALSSLVRTSDILADDHLSSNVKNRLVKSANE